VIFQRRKPVSIFESGTGVKEKAMAAKSIKEVLNSHPELIREFQAQVKATEKKKPANREFVIQEKEKLAAGLRARLEDAQQAKKTVMGHYDEVIKSLKEKEARLQKEIESDRANIKKIASPRKRG
jgi:DNA repair exonuclease SbcCD ATPase subunit